MSDFCFRSISLEQMDRISSNFVNALILTRSGLVLLPVIFRKFVKELRPLMSAFHFRSIFFERMDRI